LCDKQTDSQIHDRQTDRQILWGQADRQADPVGKADGQTGPILQADRENLLIVLSSLISGFQSKNALKTIDAKFIFNSIIWHCKKMLMNNSLFANSPSYFYVLNLSP
jgi:hypothetical protein